MRGPGGPKGRGAQSCSVIASPDDAGASLRGGVKGVCAGSGPTCVVAMAGEVHIRDVISTIAGDRPVEQLPPPPCLIPPTDRAGGLPLGLRCEARRP